ncbi:hypothetical protein U9M48_036532 [Paspalum notatum var. saurae]|uniref:Uncharacterized protein n=1 Tax=Paspalum notatum var. saurae TaxID=547442 RepID=A0AAQ3UDC6_PASNO
MFALRGRTSLLEAVPARSNGDGQGSRGRRTTGRTEGSRAGQATSPRREEPRPLRPFALAKGQPRPPRAVPRREELRPPCILACPRGALPPAVRETELWLGWMDKG